LARELAAMLGTAEHVDECGFLSQRPRLDAAVAAGLQGKRIGPYLIEAELGHGGGGSVWKARRIDAGSDGCVAIKLLHMSLLGPRGLARFQREGAMLSRLSHPDIVRLLDTGVTPEGQPYLVLEHVDGLPIDKYCDLNRVSLRGRLRLLHDVMDSVVHAHAQQIVHRDIKPSNILVTPQGRVKLLDFGIARMLGPAPEDTLLAMDGQRVLTPRYAAPEQLEGAPPTAGTDVYSLGVLMYRLLIGRYPTSADGASAAEVITGTLTVEPARLATALERVPAATAGDVRQIAASRNTTVKGLKRMVRGDLDAIVGRALRKAPGQRYGSVAAFAADITRYADGQPV
jgi:serine/threonine-protein kinase